MPKPVPIVVLLSGNGSTLQAIIDAKLPITIKAVMSNIPSAYGLIRARSNNIPTETIPHQDFSTRSDFDKALQACIDQYAPKFVILAGFMRVLGAKIVKHYQWRMINIHPSLLPKYRGLNTHKQALDAGDTEHGSTAHYVSAELDGGPIIAQAACPILPEDSETTLKTRVQTLEHQLYPEVIRWLAEGRLSTEGQIVLLNNKPLPPNGFSWDVK